MLAFSERRLAPSAGDGDPRAESGDFFQLAAVPAAQVDAITRKFLAANRRFAQLVGYSEAELRAMTIVDLALPEERDQTLEALDEAARGERDESTLERQLRRKDGTLRWVSLDTTLLRDAGGNALRMLAIAHDISAAKRAEAALRESERQLNVVLDTAPVSILYLDRAMRIKFANRAYLQRLRKTAGEVIGHDISEVKGESNFSRVEPYMHRALAGEEVHCEISVRYPELGRRELQMRFSPEFAADGSVQGIVAAILDITERKLAEASARANEQRLSAIFAGVAAGLCELSLDGTFEHLNDELCRMLGRSRETLLGTNILAVTHPEDAIATLRAIGEVMEVGGRGWLDKRHLREDGQELWTNVRLTRLDDEHGRPRGILVVIVDLSLRREAGRALLESEAKFRTLADASPAIIWFVDDRGETRYVNRRYLEFFGKTEADIFVAGWAPSVHPEDAPEYTAAMLGAVHERRPFSCRARVRRHDDEWRWIESQALPHFGEDGRYLGHVGHSLDITETLEATAALRRSEERLRRATEIETVGIAFFDISGRITETNEAFLALTGYTRDDIAVGVVRWDQMTPPEWLTRTARAMDELAALGRTIPYEKQYLRKDGSRWWGLSAATRLSPDEGVEFVIDITERKLAENKLHGYHEELEARVLHRTAELDHVNGALRDEILERTNAEKSRQDMLRQLVTVQEDERRRISRELHDQVGQDITALMLGLKALDWRDRNPPPRDTLQKLQTLTERIGKQIHDLALEIRPTALDDLGLLRTLSNYVDEWSKRTGIEVDFHSGGWRAQRLPPAVETTFYRIVCEALNNVVKHAAATCVSLIIERRGDEAVAIIEDDGKGFDPDQIRTGGQRLGIVGMRERATLAGGDLNIESSPEGGTTLFVRIPVPPALPK